MASDPPADLLLTPINGKGKTIEQWLTMFHLVLLVLDPFTNESAWLLPTVRRINHTFAQADCRVALLMAADAKDCQRFLGPVTQEALVFADPDRTAIKGLGLQRLPAIVHIAMDGTIVTSAEGWHPAEWRRVCNGVAKVTRWATPTIPDPSDPGPFEGSPALEA